ncbi:MAG: biopolymer transporter ExbD [Thiovulaceae bacterium]|nr:biopolymer transporter ExbD [Sulfurimonadaceae bacterium]
MAIKKIESINVIPFIDIMLVLLAIVLTTATFIAKGAIKVDLPKASAASAKVEKPHDITLTKEGKLYLDGVATTNEKLLSSLGTVSKETTIIINGDAKMNYEYFVSTIDTLTNAGYTHLSISTKKE